MVAGRRGGVSRSIVKSGRARTQGVEGAEGAQGSGKGVGESSPADHVLVCNFGSIVAKEPETKDGQQHL